MRNIFVNRESGTICIVDRVDENIETGTGYAQLRIVLPKESRYAMPLKQYDTEFVRTWRPATVEDLDRLISPQYRPPYNDSEWDTPEE